MSDNLVRQYAGAVARFTDGALVEKVSLPSDFSAACLSMLPVGSSPETVSAHLARLGFAVPPGSVRILPQQQTATLTAIIRLEDA